ncbi:MAG TPA: cold shock domain-containing protein [bacterium]|nr:cold shock domain-containing protein [bacterium]HPN30013.1 cold shock domain-containing protein [bacterium]
MIESVEKKIVLGKVISFDSVKGFGFISQLNSDNKPVFFHYSDIKSKGAGKFKTLKPEQIVEFELKNSTLPYRAIRISEKKY